MALLDFCMCRFLDVNHHPGWSKCAGMASALTAHINRMESHVMPQTFICHLINFLKRENETKRASREELKIENETFILFCNYVMSLDIQ